MADPLQTAAAEIAPVEPSTKFFDPSASLGIMQRYGMSGQSRAFAEGALKSANEIDQAVNYDPINRRNDLERHDWNRTTKDREDKAYEEKKLYESTLAESVMSLSQLDIGDPEFDTKIGGFAGNPEAMKNDAVKALVSMKIQQREQKGREKLQDLDYEKRFGDDIIQSTGAKPEEVWGPDGFVKRGNLPAIYGANATAKLQQESAKNSLQDLKKTLGEDYSYLAEQPLEVAASVRASAAKGLVDAAAAQKQTLFTPTAEALTKTLDDNPNLPREAYIAQVIDLSKQLDVPPGSDRQTYYLTALANRAELPAELGKLVKAAEGIWVANHAMKFARPAAAKTPASGKPAAATTPQTIKDRLEAAKQQATQPTQ